MSTTAIRDLLDFTLLQSAAECYWDKYLRKENPRGINDVLKAGNNDPEKLNKSASDPLLPGATRFTDAQIDYFTANFDIITHYPNDTSGFSATLFRNKNTQEYTLAFRSTEYQFQEKGGDWECDGKDGTDGDINKYGFGLGQLSSMEAFYANLKQGKGWNTVTKTWEDNADLQVFKTGEPPLNLVGYSLGAHLASAFTLMHADEVQGTWTFNAAGLGGINNSTGENNIPTGANIAKLISDYDALMQGNNECQKNQPEIWQEYAWGSQYLGDYINAPKSAPGTNIYQNGFSLGLHNVVMNLMKHKMTNVKSIGIGRAVDAAKNFDPVDLNSFTSSKSEVSEVSGTGWEKITQYYGHGEFLDMEFVANSGWHVKPTSIFVEDMPLSREFDQQVAELQL